MDPFPTQRTAVVAEMPTATLRVRAARIDVVAGLDTGRAVRVESPRFVVGSGPTADLRLSDDTVSREHLRLSISAQGVTLRDAGSTNGTWMGTFRIGEITLAQAATFALGNTQLTITVDVVPLELSISEASHFGSAIGHSPAMRHVFATLGRAAASDMSVLIEGESGVGKEVLAQAIHTESKRASGPFVTVDCGAIPPNLIESELFGHERGAFTGADHARIGAFEQANGGTIFLDELGELPLAMQPRLLRVLEMREVRPVGGQKVRAIDVRIVAATHRNLAEAANRNEFRRDLFYRLAVVRAQVPPLRERREDIVPLAEAFLHRLPGFATHPLPPELASMFRSYAWPGNVRELRNVVHRYAVLGPDATALFEGASTLGARAPTPLAHLPYHEARRIALEQFDEQYFPAIMARANNVVSRAAQLAEVGRGSFHRMLNRMRGAATAEPNDGEASL